MSIPSISFAFGEKKSTTSTAASVLQGSSLQSIPSGGNNQHYTHLSPSSTSSAFSSSTYESHHQPRSKRKHGREEESSIDSSSRIVRTSLHGNNRIHKAKHHQQRPSPPTAATATATFQRSKKHKTNEILGEPLPIARLIQSLDQKSLQTLLTNLIEARPDITQEVMQLAPKITVERVLEILNDQMDQIIASLPYKVDQTSDYSYYRVQKLVIEFFNLFSDYILNFMAPVENDITITLKFLNEFLMNIFHKLPLFTNMEFKFYHNLSIEKLNYIFITHLNSFLKMDTKKSTSNILIVIQDNWLKIVGQINELNHFKFQKVYDFLNEEIELFETRGEILSSDDAEEETDHHHHHNENTTNTRTRLKGLNNLINFTEANNSPLIGAGDPSYLL